MLTEEGFFADQSLTLHISVFIGTCPYEDNMLSMISKVEVGRRLDLKNFLTQIRLKFSICSASGEPSCSLIGDLMPYMADKIGVAVVNTTMYFKSVIMTFDCVGTIMEVVQHGRR